MGSSKCIAPCVRLDDNFWNGFRTTIRCEGIPYQWKALNDDIPDAEPSYCIENFLIAAGRKAGEHHGWVFQDSDIYKWIEGAAYTLSWHPDPELEATVDRAVEIVAAAQQPDGYLDTYYIINGMDQRWTNLRDNHELYCAGHLIEAAEAYYQVTGKRRLLDVALRLVDHIRSVVGPEEGKLHGYPGHPIIEMALMRLYEVTGNPAHLELARYFVDQRGQRPFFYEAEAQRNGVPCEWKSSMSGFRYYQAHKPVREQDKAVGHAVRAVYLYSGMADLARETGDEALAKTCRRLWKNLTERRMYITGAIGSSEYGEGFTSDYDLPNDTDYGETCASIGLVFFARRMLRLEPCGQYADIMERALYNGVICGIQLDGKRFFYVNPLEVVPQACADDYNKRHVKPERQKWFGCACCPPNIIRLLASLQDYICDEIGDALFVHLYIGGTIRTDGFVLEIETNYPWDGSVDIRVDAEQPVERTLALRIPAWCERWTLSVNGVEAEGTPVNGYIRLTREWSDGDRASLRMEMSVCTMHANPRVCSDIGMVALQRGPLVYCLEEADNGPMLHALRLSPQLRAETKWEPDMLNGIVMIETDGLRQSLEDWENKLYLEAEPREEPVRLRWIPYYAWANRGLGEMRVWVRT